MIKEWPIYHQLRLTLEALTPHGVHTGFGDTTHDVLLVRDPNGLPALPAASIAGVLRHLYAEEAANPGETDSLFGFAEGSTGQPSRVRFTWGLIHDSSDTPVEGLNGLPAKDPLLDLLLAEKPLVRHRIRLNEKGSTAYRGKFDVTLVPAGCRYTCFIGCWSDGSDDHEAQWECLLVCLQSAAFRLGHGTRSGQGAFIARSFSQAKWDLRDPKGREAYQARPRRRRDVGNLNPMQWSNTKESTTLPTFVQPLIAEAGWRIGGGDVSLTNTGNGSGKAPRQLPQSEPRIVWDGSGGRVEDHRLVMPASAIKGALAHRVAYHDYCLRGQWVDSEPTSAPVSVAVNELFGGEGTETEEARTGCVLLDDLYLVNPTVTWQMHNRIDRFTGGAMRGGTSKEELIWQTPFTLKLSVKPNAQISAVSRQALQRALEDLACGWLPLGAGGSRGNGVFIAEQEGRWSDGGEWLNQAEPTLDSKKWGDFE